MRFIYRVAFVCASFDYVGFLWVAIYHVGSIVLASHGFPFTIWCLLLYDSYGLPFNALVSYLVSFNGLVSYWLQYVAFLRDSV